jgi:hypothetical protein
VTRDVDGATAHGMVFRGEGRYVSEQPRRFGDLSGHVIGPVAQRSAAPQPIETEAPPSLELAAWQAGRRAPAPGNELTIKGRGSVSRRSLTLQRNTRREAASRRKDAGLRSITF